MSRRLGVSVLMIAVSAGCSSEPEAKPLGAEQFTRQSDRGGAIVPTALPTDLRNANPPPVQPIAVEPGGDTQAVVNQQVKSATPAASQPLPTTVPASAFAVGQYVSIGAIIAEVNGTPIYADDVLRSIAPLLAARAKDVEESEFRGLAASEIGRQVEEMIRSEAEYAAADRNTSAEDKQVAERLTQQWRDKLKTDNKGSIEEVRRQFREQGRTYDEVAKEQYRTNLTRVYVHKKLVPRIQVTALDVRQYYDQNRDALFTVRDNITFRLIKITAAATGSDAAARAKIEALAARAGRGEDFATMAGQTNDDPLLLKTKGLVGPIDRGAFVLDDVEAALWKINVGDTTPVLQVRGDYYLGALEAKKLGRVMSFEEDAVQKRVFDTLQAQQLTRLRQDMFARLQSESVTTRNRDTYATTLAMAMQSYPTWHSAGHG